MALAEDAKDIALRVQEIIDKNEEEIKSTQVIKDIELELDPGHLVVADINTLDERVVRNPNTRDEYLTELARDNIQVLLNRVWQLPRIQQDNLTYVTLPTPTVLLPREKPVPKPRPETKWEQYAREKGIQKKKKAKKLWDEVLKKWVPRYGYRKVQAEREKNWMMEVPANADPYEDQFAKAAEAKKERVAKNEFQRLRNIARAKKVPIPSLGVANTDTRDIKELGKALHYSRYTTASMGKFQPPLAGEKPVKGISKKRKRADASSTQSSVAQENIQAAEVVKRIKRPELDMESVLVREMKEQQQEERSKQHGKKQKRRSKMGGKKKSKSGKQLEALTGGKVGPKKGRGGKAGMMRKKSAFGGATARKASFSGLAGKGKGKGKGKGNKRR